MLVGWLQKHINKQVSKTYTVIRILRLVMKVQTEDDLATPRKKLSARSISRKV